MGKVWSSNVALPATPREQAGGPLLGKILLRQNAVSNDRLMRALVLQQHQRAKLGQILVAQGWASRAKVLRALADQHDMPTVTLKGRQMSRALLGRKAPTFWLLHTAVPWMKLGDTVVIAIAHPEERATLETALGESFPQVKFVLADEEDIRAAIATHFRRELAHNASSRTPNRMSCRNLLTRTVQRALCGLMILPAAGLILAPQAVFGVLTLAALLCLCLFMSLKLVGLLSHIQQLKRTENPTLPANKGQLRRLPSISVLVPLFKEAEISRDLLRRLGRLSYPRTLLEVFLVLEEDDSITKNAVARVDLPHWIKVIEVPRNGGLQTKPRAMNYVLDFCRGDLVGVWDAEDAPEGDQLEKVAHAFADAPPRVACFQGVLDYYNPTTNWLSRCFTLEYAGWFRVVLPALSKLGLVLPLGGTTMFIRRSVLLEIGGWDAHNVTEDADLGVRLYRAGYETRMLPSTTYEEANCRPWPWVKQRSRWLKGFMVTYLVHMRRAGQLRKDIGWWRLFGLQAFFIGTVGQFLLAPVLWTYWLMWFNIDHPVATGLSEQSAQRLVIFMLGCEALSILLAIAAAFACGQKRLAFCAPTLLFYYPLGTIAAYKALYELIFKPFYWDKTQHGLHSDQPSASGPKVTLTSVTVARAGSRPASGG